MSYYASIDERGEMITVIEATDLGDIVQMARVSGRDAMCATEIKLQRDALLEACKSMVAPLSGGRAPIWWRYSGLLNKWCCLYCEHQFSTEPEQIEHADDCPISKAQDALRQLESVR